MFTAGIVLGFSEGGWSVSDEWNRLLPDYEFVRADDFLNKWFAGGE
jgi:hypothetical protein